eukprot:TRINITY_DN27412_c0_g1_i1.p1 TRINITY_DN27412_c0_g1~~TRINITY_DN27412_c0_g1_i1.p1  ORF type:complete len:829 (+),score=185.15 TRINITY_DN27412_c0_g1_i1:200-2686(+)
MAEEAPKSAAEDLLRRKQSAADGSQPAGTCKEEEDGAASARTFPWMRKRQRIHSQQPEPQPMEATEGPRAEPNEIPSPTSTNVEPMLVQAVQPPPVQKMQQGVAQHDWPKPARPPGPVGAATGEPVKAEDGPQAKKLGMQVKPGPPPPPPKMYTASGHSGQRPPANSKAAFKALAKPAQMCGAALQEPLMKPSMPAGPVHNRHHASQHVQPPNLLQRGQGRPPRPWTWKGKQSRARPMVQVLPAVSHVIFGEWGCSRLTSTKPLLERQRIFGNAIGSMLQAATCKGLPRLLTLDISGAPWPVTVLEDLLWNLSKNTASTFRLKACDCSLTDDHVEVIMHWLELLMPDQMPLEIHLAHNQITTDGFLALMQVCEEKAFGMTRRICPLWLRVEGNFINAGEVKDLVPQGRACLAQNSKCGPTTCERELGVLIHLPYGMNQRVAPPREGDDPEETEEEAECKAEVKEEEEHYMEHTKAVDGSDDKGCIREKLSGSVDEAEDKEAKLKEEGREEGQEELRSAESLQADIAALTEALLGPSKGRSDKVPWDAAPCTPPKARMLPPTPPRPPAPGRIRIPLIVTPPPAPPAPGTPVRDRIPRTPPRRPAADETHGVSERSALVEEILSSFLEGKRDLSGKPLASEGGGSGGENNSAAGREDAGRAAGDSSWDYSVELPPVFLPKEEDLGSFFDGAGDPRSIREAFKKVWAAKADHRRHHKYAWNNGPAADRSQGAPPAPPAEGGQAPAAQARSGSRSRSRSASRASRVSCGSDVSGSGLSGSDRELERSRSPSPFAASLPQMSFASYGDAFKSGWQIAQLLMEHEHRRGARDSR